MTWSPTDEGGIVAWYRADDLSLSDNDSVSSWSDASGNSRTLSSLSGTDPIYKTGISPGGSPVVRFSAGALGTSSFNRSAVGSLFFFGKWNANSTNQVGPYHGNPGGTGFGFFMRNTNVVDVLFGGVIQFPAAASSSDFRSHGALIYDSGTPRGALLLDDTSAGTTNSGARTPGVNPIFLGGVSGQYMNADVCEFVYFDHVLDSTARANLQAYFESRHLDTTPASAVLLPVPAVTASGAVTPPGTATAVLPVPGVTALGQVFATTVVTGTATCLLPLPTVASVGSVVSFTTGTAAVDLPLPVAAGVGIGVVGSSGAGQITLPLPEVLSEGVAHDPYEEEEPDSIDRVVLGSYRYKTRVRLVQGSTAERVDVIDGAYRFDAGAIPMRRLDAEVHVPTLSNVDLLDVAATKVTVAVVATQLNGDTSETVAQVPLWLQSIRKTVDGRGTRYSIQAVDILGRLSANGLRRPVQSAATCMGTIRRLLNNSGHHHGVLVWKDADVTDRDAPDRAVYDGDPVYAAQEMVEQMDAIMVSIAPNAVRIMKAPRVNPAAVYTTDTVTSYTTVQERVPSLVLVESSSTDGTRDVTGTAGGAGSGDYGTVTARFYRPVRNSTQADRAARSLLARVKGRGYRLEQVEMIPNAAVAFGQTWKVKHSGASRGVVWSYDLPLVPNRPMILRMRTPEDA